LIGKKVSDLPSALKSIERMVPVSARYREVLTEFGGAVVFENGAIFTTDEPSRLNDRHGYQSLEIVFGLGNGKYSVKQLSERYSVELPESFVPIGEAPGGNLVCVDRSGVVYLWDHESARGEAACKVAKSLDDFFDRLEPEGPETSLTDGIIESESFLDF
jgi:hypothetical protein